MSVVQHGRIVDQTLEILAKLHPEYTERDLEMIRRDLKKGLPPFNADTAPGLVPNIIAGRIANRLDLMGPSYTVDAACASSLIAIEMAVRGLRYREYDMALVGGAHVATPAPVLMLFCQLGALSRREQIRPFDKDADGTVLGEGVGMVVLKRRQDAERDGNRVYAVIKGVGSSSDGRGMGVMAPRLEGEVLALQRAYETAQISPRTVGLIEAHGTGTPVGDATEVKALTEVFGAREGGELRCALGSVKSMVGHLMPAAGIAGVIKTALSLYHRVLPPTLHVDQPGPSLELDKSALYINTETRPWVHGGLDSPRRAGVNSFGFGGINAHVILEEDTRSETSEMDGHQLEWSAELFVVSAESHSELIRSAGRLRQFTERRERVNLKDLAFALSASLGALPHRAAIVASSKSDLEEKLRHLEERLSDSSCRKVQDVKGVFYFAEPLGGRLAVLFPGEGCQYVNMLADVCIHFPEVRQAFDSIDRAFMKHSRGYVPSDFIFPKPSFTPEEREQAEERIWRMEGAVEAVLSANGALYLLLHRLGIKPDAVLGHSTGEYSAMLASGMIDLRDDEQISEFALQMNEIYRRASSEMDIPRSALLAVAADARTLSSALEGCGEDYDIAMVNCPHQVVVAVEEAAAAKLQEELSRRGLICELLPFDRPYHTPRFGAFAEKLRAFFSQWIVSTPRIETYSCTSTAPFPRDLREVHELEVQHWMRPVEFQKTIESMYSDGIRIFVEAGPRGNLSAFVDDILRGRPHLALPSDVMGRSGLDQLQYLVGILAAQGVPVALEQLYKGRRPARVSLEPESADERKPKPLMKLATGAPPMTLSTETVLALRSKQETSARWEEAEAVDVTPAPPRPDTTSKDPLGTEEAARVPAARPAPGKSSAAMSAYLENMERFLSAQQEVMQAFLTGRPSVSSPDWVQDVVENTRETPRQEVGRRAAAPAEPPSTEAPPDSAPRREEAAGTDEVAQAGGEDIKDRLLRLVSDRTGYPPEMLDLDLNIEADLGIDSIKRVEILGSLQRETGLLVGDDMEALSGAKTLRQILDFLISSTEPSGDEPAVATDTGEAEPPRGGAGEIPSMPFLRDVVSRKATLQQDDELVVNCAIDLAQDLYLRDHTLGHRIAMTDPELRGLPIMPFTMSMEMMAESGAVLFPELRLLEMREIRAHRWIALDRERLELQIIAKRRPMDGEARVEIREAGETRGATPIVEATLVFGTDYPEAPIADELPLASAQPVDWPRERIYKEAMFHGPAFRGVSGVSRMGADGALAALDVLASEGLFPSNDASLVTDPVLLDQPGQVVGIWTADRLDTAYVIFPFLLRKLRLFGLRPAPGSRFECRARIALVGERQVRSDLDIVDGEGRLYAQLLGWEDRRFHLPLPFYRFLLAPRESTLSRPWAEPVARHPSGCFKCYRLDVAELEEDLLEAHGGFWRNVLAHMVLNGSEREHWRRLESSEKRRTEWLLGRVAAKDAVRQYVKERHGMELCPADIEIASGEHGRPVVRGAWSGDVARVPVVSLTHSEGVAVAVVGDSEAVAGLGVDLEPTVNRSADIEHQALTADERTLLSSLASARPDSWPVRIWCAKEAVAKALGLDNKVGPQSLVVLAVDPDRETVDIRPAGRDGMGDPREAATLTAFTSKEGDFVVATSFWSAQEEEITT